MRANKYMIRRGPDSTRAVGYGDIVLLHNLLHISGEQAYPQPVANETESIIALFNGEIYNFKDIAPDADSDTQCIIQAYLMYGDAFAKHLDGEFAIVLWDRESDKIIVTSDVFMTKPLFISITFDEIGVATYQSALDELGFKDISMFRPNMSIVLDISNPDSIRIASTSSVYEFNLDQYKTTFDDWESAFFESVRKRGTHGNANLKENMFVTLSSGYDSGAITLALNRLNIPYASYTSYKNEDKDVLHNRLLSNRLSSCTHAFQVQEITDIDHNNESAILFELAEPFVYVHDDMPGQRIPMWLDGGAKALSFICRQMTDYNYRVCLSGSGADEIMTDYGFQGNKMYHHSQFGGMFPKDLKTIFPWSKFYDDTQRSYLFKDEFVCGAYHIEGRYPFLDPVVVQEYINIDHSVKNKTYKAPLAFLFEKYKYPYETDTKRGFNI